MDTLLLPSSGMKRATVRWIPGPVEITGTGYALLHCHIMPHSDEGCILKTQLLTKRCAAVTDLLLCLACGHCATSQHAPGMLCRSLKTVLPGAS